MVWAQLAGTGIQYEANSREDMRKRELARRQGDAQSQADQWGRQSDAQTMADLRALQQQRYGAQRQLVNSLSSPDRLAAGQAAGVQARARLQTALAGNEPTTAVDRTNVNTPAFAGWGANTTATYAPQMQARMNLIADQRGQGAMGQYDQNALNQNADTGIDINRQVLESQQRQQYLAAVRQRMLAEAGVKNADNGPGNGYFNAQLLAGLIGAGGQAYGAYAGGQQQPGGYSYANTNEVGASQYER